MSKFNIFIDSATKRTNRYNKYGESIAAWAIWRNGMLNEKPIKCGIHYFKYEGPNKVFYEGIIRGLEQCMSLIWDEDELIILGDCKPVLGQLKGEIAVGKMEKYFDQVQALKRKYRGIIKFEYINEKDLTYKKIDQLAKRSRSYITKILE